MNLLNLNQIKSNLILRKILILIAIIFASISLTGQRNEDLALIVSKKLLNVDSIAGTTHKYNISKEDSFFSIILKIPIIFWKEFISSQMKPRCYFYPSCSQFSLEAIQQYGLRGFFLGIDRIFRCNVFSEEKYPYYKNTNRLYDPVSRYQVNTKKTRKDNCPYD